MVVVVLVPVVDGDRTGLLVGAPGHPADRQAHLEAGVDLDPAKLEPPWCDLVGFVAR